MANTGYGCEFGDCVTPPNHLLTTLSPAATVSLCDEHYAPGLIPLLAAELGVDPGDFYANVERYLAREAKKAAAALEAANAAVAAEKQSRDAAGTGDDDQGDDATARVSAARPGPGPAMHEATP